VGEPRLAFSKAGFGRPQVIRKEVVGWGERMREGGLLRHTL